MNCSICKKVITDTEGYYFYGEKSYCSKCWEKNPTYQALKKNNDWISCLSIETLEQREKK